MKKLVLGLIFCTGLAGHLPAVLVQFDVGQTVPDNDPSGLVSVGTVSGSGIASIADVNVFLEVSGGYSGDLYVTLSHAGGYSVLLNRVGRRTSDPYGYTEPGFSSTFKLDDQADNGDVHIYRFTLFENHSTPIGSPLGETWAPDARTADPGTVQATDPRDTTAMLSSFNNLNADGEWTLFLVDLEPIGESRLINWGLEVSGVIPEPTTLFAGSLLLLPLGLSTFRAMRKRHRDDQALDKP